MIYSLSDRIFPYGPGLFFKSVLGEALVTMLGEGTEMRNYFHVQDLVQVAEA